MQYLNLIWVFLLLTSLRPWYRVRQVQRGRLQAIVSFQRQRRSRLITPIHRQETMSLFGIPISRHISVVLPTPGGLVLATEQIAGPFASTQQR
jgi:hypothetical protein